jgi:3-hydroxyacyl-CoA dehydrogenase/enoyl-CoA hydratase/3-hydroxybutyryl-CoA epimerase
MVTGSKLELDGDDHIRVLHQLGSSGDPPILDHATRTEWNEVLTDLEANPPQYLIVRSRHEEWFCAGADVEELASVDSEQDAFDLSRSGQELFQRLSDLESTSVAMMAGDALGGGLELALACDALFVADDPEVRMGLPEVKLGIIPGFGGTQRLPRAVGIRTALEMILTGRKYTPLQADSFSLADRLLPPDGIHNQTEQILRRETGELSGEDDRGMLDQLLEDTTPGRHYIFKKARERTKEKAGDHYPAPFAAIDAIENGLDQPIEEGLCIEARAVAELATNPTTRHQMELFLHMNELQENSREQAEIGEPVRAGVIGAGVMGGGIAQLFAYNRMDCRLKDIASAPLQQGLKRARDVFEKGVDQGKWTSSFVRKRMGHISPTTSWQGFEQTDVLVEAVPEQLDVKRQVFGQMEEHTSDHTILATNTSSIRLSDIGQALDHPERLVGLHFFNPVYKMPLVEVIAHDQTDPSVLQRARRIVTKLGKTPVVVEDGPGFLVNRLLFFYLQEAMILFQEGAEIDRIDQVLRSFGMPQGPFEVLDQVGLDVSSHVSETLHAAFEDRAVELTLLDQMLDQDWLGKKSGTGFYRYGDGQEINTELHDLMDRKDREPGVDEIRDRLLLSLINEAVRVINTGLVNSPRDLDTAMILGTGFAPFRGGPWAYARERGWGDIHQRLEEFQSTFGERFEPAENFPDHSDRNEPSRHSPGESAESPTTSFPEDTNTSDPETAIVFSGGGARGAYEAGVLSGLSKHVFPELDEEPNINVLVGTSSGAINAYYLAGCLDRFSEGVSEMVELWKNLNLEDHLVPTSTGSYSLLRWLMGNDQNERMSLLDPSEIRNMIKNDFPWERIRPSMDRGDLHSLCVTATKLKTGQSILFTDTAHEQLPVSPVGRDLGWIRTQILPIHVFGSSSIPLFFPATRIDGTLYYDGGLRMDVPITPAISLGAKKIFVIGVKPPSLPFQHEQKPHVPQEAEEGEQMPENEPYPGAPEMIGKIMNALMIDPVERERQRLFSLKDILHEARKDHGAAFADRMAEKLSPYTGGNLGDTSIHYHRPSRNFGRLASKFVPDIADRLGGLRGQVFRRFANSDATGNWDLASYMLFDREYATELISQGEDDVREHQGSIQAFFEE